MSGAPEGPALLALDDVSPEDEEDSALPVVVIEADEVGVGSCAVESELAHADMVASASAAVPVAAIR
ncbi:MAG: hypothetical protein ABF545_04470 [Bifidobacterium psychraerophilum]|uniref:hypothetical protein n=1 Tax=Bifidobacterium psychraerophilum TaxID=218140 RepID=UPI0039ED1C2A